MRNWLLFIALSLGYFVAGALPANAASLGISPQQIDGEGSRSWFVSTLNRGESKHDVVSISNDTESALEVFLEALDGVSTNNGGYSLVSSVSENQDLGTWINLERASVVIAPLASVKVGFTINVPSTASAGEHRGGIAVYAKNDSTQLNDDTRNQTHVAARIYVTVPGEITRDIVFEEATHRIEDGRLFFDIKAQNKSNIILEPALDISMRNLFFSTTQSEDTTGTFLAGSDMVIEKEWTKRAPRFGYYSVNLVLHTWTVKQTLPDGTVSILPDQTFEYSFGFWVGSTWLIWALLMLLLGWLGYRAWAYLGDRSKYLMEHTTYIVKKGDTVVRIAEERGTKVKQIVRLNALPWPHTINAKDKLLVPRGRLSADGLQQKRMSDPMPSFWVYLISIKISLYHPSVEKL